MTREVGSKKTEVRGETTDAGCENRDLVCEIRDMRYGTRIGIQQNIGGFNIDDIIHRAEEEKIRKETERIKNSSRKKRSKRIETPPSDTPTAIPQQNVPTLSFDSDSEAFYIRGMKDYVSRAGTFIDVEVSRTLLSAQTLDGHEEDTKIAVRQNCLHAASMGLLYNVMANAKKLIIPPLESPQYRKVKEFSNFLKSVLEYQDIITVSSFNEAKRIVEHDANTPRHTKYFNVQPIVTRKTLTKRRDTRIKTAQAFFGTNDNYRDINTTFSWVLNLSLRIGSDSGPYTRGHERYAITLQQRKENINVITPADTYTRALRAIAVKVYDHQTGEQL